MIGLLRRRSLWTSFALGGCLVWGGACRSTATASDLHWQPCATGSRASLRGLAAIDAQVAWVSGAHGTVLRTSDGGASWSAVAPPGTEALDFRSIHAWDAQRACVANAGSPARIYRTVDGGRTWALVHEAAEGDAFFDAIAFVDADHGLVFGDPSGARMRLLATDDAGAHWRPVPAEWVPAAIAGEAAFAASGTCLVARPMATFVQVTGGAVARCLRSDDGGRRWSAVRLPLCQGHESQGAFAAALDGGSRVVVVGGDYREPLRHDGTAAWSADGGRTFQAADAGGFRCGVAFVPQAHGFVAVGDRGASLSRDGGVQWQSFGGEGYYAVRCAPDGAVWASGSDGRVARLHLAGSQR